MARPPRTIPDVLVTTLAAVTVVLVYAFLTRPPRPVGGADFEARLELILPEVNLEKVSFEQATRFLEAQTGLTVVFDPKELTSARTMFSRVITLKEENVRAGQLLVMILSQSEMERLTWCEDAGRIRIRPFKAVAAPDPRIATLRLYDVADLLDEDVSFRARVAATTQPSTGPVVNTSLESASAYRLQSVINRELFRRTDFPHRRALHFPAVPRIYGKTLLIQADASGHRRVEDTLSLLRRR